MKKLNSLIKKALPLALATTLFSPLYPTKENNAHALEIYPVIFLDDSSPLKTDSQTTQQSNQQTQQKHYNWIKSNKYSDWQCAYELTYDDDIPNGFKLYVDIDGDNKPNYTYKYVLTNVGHYYTGIDFDFELDYYYSPVGDSSFEDNAIKALNTCGLQAIRRFIYYETDHDDPADYMINKVNFGNYHYPYVSFHEK